MASSNLFKNSVDESIVSSASGICNTGISINDSSNSSVYAPSGQPVSSSNSSDRQSNELIDLNNLEVSLNARNSQLNRLASPGRSVGHHPTSLSAAADAAAADHHPHNQQAIDIALQNYLLDYKSFADDTKSMTSVMTSKSTRETFECLSRVLPVGILLLIVFIMIHFVLYVRDIEPFQSITEVICIALAVCVFTLSSAFIVKIFCDSKDRSHWTNDPYADEYVYSPTNHYFYTGGGEQAGLASANLPSHLIHSSASKPPPSNFLNPVDGAEFAALPDAVIRKQPHYYAAQAASLEYKNKRHDLPGYYPTTGAPSPNYGANRLEQSTNPFNPSQFSSGAFNASHFGQTQFNSNQFNSNQFNSNQFNSNQFAANQFGQPSPTFNRRTSASDSNASFDPRNSTKLQDKKIEQCIQTINLIEARRKEVTSLIKETAT